MVLRPQTVVPIPRYLGHWCQVPGVNGTDLRLYLLLRQLLWQEQRHRQKVRFQTAYLASMAHLSLRQVRQRLNSSPLLQAAFLHERQRGRGGGRRVWLREPLPLAPQHATRVWGYLQEHLDEVLSSGRIPPQTLEEERWESEEPPALHVADMMAQLGVDVGVPQAMSRAQEAQRSLVGQQIALLPLYYLRFGHLLPGIVFKVLIWVRTQVFLEQQSAVVQFSRAELEKVLSKPPVGDWGVLAMKRVERGRWEIVLRSGGSLLFQHERLFSETVDLQSLVRGLAEQMPGWVSEEDLLAALDGARVISEAGAEAQERDWRSVLRAAAQEKQVSEALLFAGMVTMAAQPNVRHLERYLDTVIHNGAFLPNVQNWLSEVQKTPEEALAEAAEVLEYLERKERNPWGVVYDFGTPPDVLEDLDEEGQRRLLGIARHLLRRLEGARETEKTSGFP